MTWEICLAREKKRDIREPKRFHHYFFVIFSFLQIGLHTDAHAVDEKHTSRAFSVIIYTRGKKEAYAHSQGEESLKQRRSIRKEMKDIMYVVFFL